MSINRPWRDPDMYAHFDAAITYDALGGDVTYRAYSTDTSQQLGQVETTTFVAH
jgi:hypothetical protein